MSERVYPRDSPPVSSDNPHLKPFVETPPVSGEHQRRMSQDSFASSKMSNGYNYGYVPNPGTYVVQVPKDQVYRVPPPENAHKYKLYTKGKARRNSCRYCICCTLSVIIILAALLALAIGIFYLIYSPKAPTFGIESVHVKGVNFTSPTAAATISPVFNVTVKTENPNGKIGFYYEQGSEVDIFHDGVNLCQGKLPAFFQPPNSATVFSTEVSGAGIVLSKSARDVLLTQQKKGMVPLEMDATIPVKIKIGSLKTWKITVKITCDVTLNALTANAKVVSKSCKVKAKPW